MANMDRREKLAREIRDELGELNDDNKPVVILIRSLVEQLKEARKPDLQIVLAYEAGQREAALECAEIAENFDDGHWTRENQDWYEQLGGGIAKEIREKYGV